MSAYSDARLAESVAEVEKWRALYSIQHDRADRAEARAAALESALLRTERNFRLAVNGKPVRDMSENLAENARALGGVS